MYDKRIYRHFLEKKIADVHQDLRKKIISESKHRKSLSLATSLNKITDKAQKLMDSNI